MEKLDTARVWGLYYRLLMTVISEAALEFEALGIEAKEFFVLDDVEAHPYPAKLAKRMSMPKPTITIYLKNLEAKGFVRREIDPDDLRRHRIIVTPAGQKILVHANKVLGEISKRRTARFNDGEGEILQRLIEKLAS